MPDFKIDPDYKEVAERLRDLFAKFPNASMRGTYEFVEGHVIYRAECYRTPDDPAPGVGTAWEEVPGRTPYTKGSELQNAETSAWGRAIVAVGASESKRIASADDIRLANDRRSAPPVPSRPAPASKERIDDLVDQIAERELGEWVKDQSFPWPWTDAACEAIGEEIARWDAFVTDDHVADVLERDGFACVVCGVQKSLTVDHVVARANGGSEEIDNLQTLCRPCNTSKGVKPMDEWLAGRS